MATPKRKMKCPGCAKSIVYDTENEFRPFCSERCKTADTASWATETFGVPGERVDIDQLPRNPGDDDNF